MLCLIAFVTKGLSLAFFLDKRRTGNKQLSVCKLLVSIAIGPVAYLVWRSTFQSY